ncbi:MAG: hypothetical protein V4450_04005 [Bacteroidota bacterium]
MVKLLLTVLWVSICISANSQSDLLVLKKRNQTIQTWVTGSIINFQFSSKQWIQGIIKTIRNDSILMEQIDIRQVPNQFGFPTIDTAKLGIMKLHVNEIYGIPKRGSGGDIFTNGTLLQLGSGAYIFLNIINSLIKNDQVFSSVNLTRIGIAGGVFLVGTLLQAGHSTYIQLGKKYTMETIHTARTKDK